MSYSGRVFMGKAAVPGDKLCQCGRGMYRKGRWTALCEPDEVRWNGASLDLMPVRARMLTMLIYEGACSRYTLSRLLERSWATSYRLAKHIYGIRAALREHEVPARIDLIEEEDGGYRLVMV